MTTYPIIVGFDGSTHAHRALRWGLDEGARTGAPVTILFVFEWLPIAGPIAPGPRVLPEQVAREDAQKLVDDAVSEAFQSHPEVVVTGRVTAGSAAALLQERSREARLIVLGGRGHGGFAELLVGSTTAAVTAHAHCPVVVVRGADRSPAGPVVAGVDGSDHALLALEYAFEQAAARGSALRVVRAWTPAAPRWRPAAYDLDEQVAAERAELDELLATSCDKYPQVEVIADVVTGPPGRVMVQASDGARLVVVGSRGHGGFRGLLLGSTSQQLLHHANCPVAVIRELHAATG
ncbi:universal stress protein [Phytohabitans kaempferiae]|uniref:Universal stress protein n=1 Tax=Phytohabitans kaempferiae TaxID=1620943 RepID=A0ABV6LZ15_9ACTN